MYVVVSGRLDVVVDGAAVRELGPGAELGELALLTGGRRYASVRARRDTSLLALSRSQFMGALEHSPETAVAVATALAETLATSRPPEPDRAGPARVIAVVGLPPGDPVAADAWALGDGLARHLDVLVSAGLSAQELALAEQQHDRVVLVAGADQLTWWQSCVRQSDRVVVVGDSNSELPATWEGPAQSDLVLVGSMPPDATVRTWSQTLSPWQIVTTRDAVTGLDGLVATLAGRSVGLVLAGGGTRAMAHIGVLRELEDAGIAVQRVAGTSLGAIVAAAHALGVDGEAVLELHYQAFVRGNPFGTPSCPRRSPKAAVRRTCSAGSSVTRH